MVASAAASGLSEAVWMIASGAALNPIQGRQ
jgi:hypothetical protein